MTDHSFDHSDAFDAVPPTPACARLDERLADYLEDDLPAAERAEVEAHLAGCAGCRALVADLRAITAGAATLPPLRPERDLWAGIAERIEAPVVAIESAGAMRVRPTTVRSVERAPQRGRGWLAAAAAALVVASSGLTWLAMRPAGGPAATVVASSDAAPRTPAPVPTPDAVTPVDAPERPTGALDAADTPADGPTAASPRAVAAAPAERAGRSTRGAPDARLVARRGGADGDPAVDALVPGAATYGREIAALRAAVDERRADLDSSTVAILDRNLRLIDEAIRQSREALARDPRSPLLGRQLERALDRKVDVLRTMALLPRT